MPTAAKLCAAALFGALAWWVSQMVRPLFPPGTDLGRFAEVNAAIGVALGWRMAGARAPAGWAASMAHGLTTVAAMVLAALFAHSFAAMIRQSLRRIYDGPVEALVGVVQIMGENAQYLAPAAIWGTLVAGGIVAGLVVEWTGRNFR